MDQKHLEHMDITFQKLRDDAAEAYRKTYADMCSQLKGSGGKGLSGEIAQLEAKNLGRLIVACMEGVEQAAVSEMMENGCKKYVTQAGWTEIQQVVGVPRTEYCKVQVDVVRPSAGGSASAKTDENRRNLEKLITKYEAAEKWCMGAAAAGALAVVVTLFIPGWDLPVKITCIAGVITAVAGGGGTIYCSVQQDQAKSKFDRSGESSRKESPKQEEKLQMDDLLSRITDSQCKRNLQLYHEWLDKVKQELIKECDKLSEV